MVAAVENDGNNGSSAMSEPHPNSLSLTPDPTGSRQSFHAIESPAPDAGTARQAATAAMSTSGSRERVGGGVMGGSFARERRHGTPQTLRRPPGTDGRRANPDGRELLVERLHLAPRRVLRGHGLAVRAGTLPRDDVVAR